MDERKGRLTGLDYDSLYEYLTSPESVTELNKWGGHCRSLPRIFDIVTLMEDSFDPDGNRMRMSGDEEDIAMSVVMEVLRSSKVKRMIFRSRPFGYIKSVASSKSYHLNSDWNVDFNNLKYDPNVPAALSRVNGYVMEISPDDIDNALSYGKDTYEVNPKRLLSFVMDKHCVFRRNSEEYRKLFLSVVISVIKRKITVFGMDFRMKDEVVYLVRRYVEVHNRYILNGHVEEPIDDRD